MKVLNQVEEWRPIAGYEGLYEISNLGRVKTYYTKGQKLKNDKEHVLTPHIMGGYYKVVLHKDKKRKMVNIHRLIAMAFLENPKNDSEVNHKDENKLNNQVSNLEWCSHRYNILYSRNIDKAYNKEKKPVRVYDKNGNFIGEYESGREAARKLNCNQGHISHCITGVAKSHNGYIFKLK